MDQIYQEKQKENDKHIEDLKHKLEKKGKKYKKIKHEKKSLKEELGSKRNFLLLLWIFISLFIIILIFPSSNAF